MTAIVAESSLWSASFCARFLDSLDFSLSGFLYDFITFFFESIPRAFRFQASKVRLAMAYASSFFKHLAMAETN